MSMGPPGEGATDCAVPSVESLACFLHPFFIRSPFTYQFQLCCLFQKALLPPPPPTHPSPYTAHFETVAIQIPVLPTGTAIAPFSFHPSLLNLAISPLIFLPPNLLQTTPSLSLSLPSFTCQTSSVFTRALSLSLAHSLSSFNLAPASHTRTFPHAGLGVDFRLCPHRSVFQVIESDDYKFTEIGFKVGSCVPAVVESSFLESHNL
jgi:hypothetical protein